ncbi:MAG: hypothetical protein IH912_04705, partial [Proteobacteria bacterium]|nr:hypothetical protein [Pseudomonadota bacterium]
MSDRISRICAGDRSLTDLVNRLVDVSTRGLPGMYHDDRRVFAHTRVRTERGLELRGVSPRYGAIAILGLRHVDKEIQIATLGGETVQEFVARQVANIDSLDNLGDVALTTWAAAECKIPDLPRALERLRVLWGQSTNTFTVEAAWTLSALVAAGSHNDSDATADQVWASLEAAFCDVGSVFPHWISPADAPFGRAHVSCFADQVYPIQALARYHLAVHDDRALEIANSCAAQICRLQGDGGQWWWHYDARNGSVIEGYPVYSVHQDAMAPMALLDLFDAGGTDFAAEIREGLRWMDSA